jgi:hypothetical protein
VARPEGFEPPTFGFEVRRSICFKNILRIREQVIPRLWGAGNKVSIPKRHSHTPHMFKIYIMYLWTAYLSLNQPWGEPTLSFYL